MDYVEGVNIRWNDLTLEHKKDVLIQVAWVLGQLANMEFEATDSIAEDGSVGPLLHHTAEKIDGGRGDQRYVRRAFQIYV